MAVNQFTQSKRPKDGVYERNNNSNSVLRVVGHMMNIDSKGVKRNLTSGDIKDWEDCAKICLKAFVSGVLISIRENNIHNLSPNVLPENANIVVSESECIPEVFTLHVLQGKDNVLDYMATASFQFKYKSVTGIGPIRFWGSQAFLGQSSITLSTFTNSNTYINEGYYDVHLVHESTPLIFLNKKAILDLGSDLFENINKKSAEQLIAEQKDKNFEDSRKKMREEFLKEFNLTEKTPGGVEKQE